jgi:hypothetical protein
MLMRQDAAQQLFCGFNRFLGDFPSHGTNTKDKGVMICSNTHDTDQWYHADKSDVIGYLYGDSIQ